MTAALRLVPAAVPAGPPDYAEVVPSAPLRPVDDLEVSFRHGDDDVLKRAYDTYGRLVYTYCRRSLGADRANEATQDVFLAAWRARSRFDSERGSLAAWLMGIARNKVIDNLRSEGRHANRRAHDEPADLPTDAEVDDLGDRLLVADALRQLPDRPREVLHLHFFEGLSHPQISERIDLPLGTVKSDIRRGLARIRRHLELQHA